LKNRIKNHKEKLDKIEKVEKLQKRGEELSKDQKDQLKKKEDILLRLSECELINDTLNAKVGITGTDKTKEVKKPSGEVKKPSVEKIETVVEKKVEKVEVVEVIKEVANVDLAVLCCQLRLVNWNTCSEIKAELGKHGVSQFDKLSDLAEATLKSANVAVLCSEVSDSGH